MNDQYASHQYLNTLDARRASKDWAGDTAILPPLAPADPDETVPLLPALCRPQI